MSRTYRHAPSDIQAHQNGRPDRGRKRRTLNYRAPDAAEPDTQFLPPLDAFRLRHQVRTKATATLPTGMLATRFESLTQKEEEQIETRSWRRNVAEECRSVAADPERWFDNALL